MGDRTEYTSEFEENVTTFLTNGCGCSGGPRGNQCSTIFSKETVLFNLRNCLELSSAELDLVILANVQASTHGHGDENVGEKRRHSRCDFRYKSIPICKEMFLHLYGLSDSRYRLLKQHYDAYGIVPRTHGNTKQLPSNTLPQQVIEEVKTFISNYVEENAILLPGRIPGYKNDDMKLLSSSESKASIWRAYKTVCETGEKRFASYPKFTNLWSLFFPNVFVAKPMTDLCEKCQANTTQLQRSINLPDEEKSACVKAQQEHLAQAKAERDGYRKACQNAEENFDSIREHFDFTKKQNSCSVNMTMHYSFDYAQQVHIPSNPLQPGPIYFKTPRKCGIFGIFCEGIPRQVNFLIDEASAVGKGANPTISYLHYFLEHHGIGETDVHLHADNCAGQNKNNFFLWFLAWRIINNLHVSIIYSFLVTGHTKFGPDRCFGMLKKEYKRSYVSSLYELAEVVESSSNVGVNKVQLVGTHDGRIIVPVFDWAAYLNQYFKKMPHIKSYQHFRFTKDDPGVVFCKEFITSTEKKIELLKDKNVLPPSDIPPQIQPEGLSAERKRYLFHDIRQYCKPGMEDLVAPDPDKT